MHLKLTRTLRSLDALQFVGKRGHADFSWNSLYFCGVLADQPGSGVDLRSWRPQDITPRHDAPQLQDITPPIRLNTPYYQDISQPNWDKNLSEMLVRL